MGLCKTKKLLHGKGNDQQGEETEWEETLPTIHHPDDQYLKHVKN